MLDAYGTLSPYIPASYMIVFITFLFAVTK